MKRMWINQPSTTQPAHPLHGRRVLAKKENGVTHQVYFLSGPIVSASLPSIVLSPGWPDPDDDPCTYPNCPCGPIGCTR